MKNILFIHGAWASRNGFNYIADNVSDRFDRNIYYFEYDCQTEDPSSIIERATIECEQLAAQGKTVVVGHSLGGILALSLADIENVTNVMTIASPINGIDGIHYFMYYFLMAKAPIFKHLTPHSAFISSLKNKNYDNETIDIVVANKGFNVAMSDRATDGTISVESQVKWIPENANLHMIEANHHEVLNMPKVVSILRNRL